MANTIETKILDVNLILDAAIKQHGWRYCELLIRKWSNKEPRTDAIQTTSSNGLTFIIYSYTQDNSFNALVLRDEHGTLFHEEYITNRTTSSKINEAYVRGINEIEANARLKLEQIVQLKTIIGGNK